MAVLKKGAKGKPVESLQKQLNKQGAKPKLKVDGLFGPITQKAVRNFQKKTGEVKDGQAGPRTLAALKFGGPLPEMPVQNYEKRTQHLAKVFAANKANYKSYARIDKAIDALSARKEVDEAMAIYNSNYKLHKAAAELCFRLIDKQKEFEKLVLTDPGRAGKIARECTVLHKKVQALGAQIGPNVVKAGLGLASYRGKLEQALKLVQAELANIEKVKKTW